MKSDESEAMSEKEREGIATTDKEVEQQFEEGFRRKHRRGGPDRFYAIRNVLNLLFMVVAVVGVVIYCTSSDKTTGTIVVLAAMALKIIECALRFIH